MYYVFTELMKIDIDVSILIFRVFSVRFFNHWIQHNKILQMIVLLMSLYQFINQVQSSSCIVSSEDLTYSPDVHML